ncbi:MAG: type II toxin-antitoxin system PemK/MazF family toxin [bacterium]
MQKKNIQAPKRGQVFKISMATADRDGHVITGDHYGIVVTPDKLNKAVQTAMVVLVTSRERPGWSWRVPFKLLQGNPNITSYAITEQIMTFDRKALNKPVGFVRAADLKIILQNIKEIFK